MSSLLFMSSVVQVPQTSLPYSGCLNISEDMPHPKCSTLNQEFVFL